MISRISRFRLRRSVRLRQRQVASLGEDAEQQLDRHFFRRLDRLVPVRRFVSVWIALVLVLFMGVVAQSFALGSVYQEYRPAPGGTYVEGIVGQFSNANPLFATTGADRTVARLLFSGLLRYNEHNQLVGDLAESWQSDPRGQVYTVAIRKDVKWHDGAPFSAQDVQFTYATIQNGDVQSPLRSSWQDVKVEALDAYTVRFTLSNPLASFPYNLTNGIVPAHILSSVAPADMRSTSFNTEHPVGTGPFRWAGLAVQDDTSDNREVQIALEKYPLYHHGAPKLDGFRVDAYENEEQLLRAYRQRELTAVSGLVSVPDKMPEGTTAENFTQTAAMMTFFRTTQGVLKDKTVRQAMIKAVNVSAIRGRLGYPAMAVDAPFLRSQFAYDKNVTQPAYNPESANAILDAAGWARGPNGVRMKDKVALAFTLYAEENKETAQVARAMQKDWKAVGANVQVVLQKADEFQVTLSEHGSYDAVLHGIAIGADPDVFVYWHSTQASVLSGTHLNFSEYASATADTSLEAGRTRVDQTLRAQKYKPFLQAWSEDSPAMGLYQPRSLYIVRGAVAGLSPHMVTTATDRFANVQDWTIRQVKTTVD